MNFVLSDLRLHFWTNLKLILKRILMLIIVKLAVTHLFAVFFMVLVVNLVNNLHIVVRCELGQYLISTEVTNSKLFQHSKVCNITFCSANPELTCLGFLTLFKCVESPRSSSLLHTLRTVYKRRGLSLSVKLHHLYHYSYT